jgi:hypothetical protein
MLGRTLRIMHMPGRCQRLKSCVMLGCMCPCEVLLANRANLTCACSSFAAVLQLRHHMGQTHGPCAQLAYLNRSRAARGGHLDSRLRCHCAQPMHHRLP